MRHSIAFGLCALFIAGSGAVALAKQPAYPTQISIPETPALLAPPDISVLPLSTPVDAPKFREAKATKQSPAAQHHIWRFANAVAARSSRIASRLTRDALRFLGTPYVFGGTSGYGFDCSGYTQHVFKMVGVSIPRMADSQFYDAHRTVGEKQPGDLVFFQTYAPGPSHVGIYLGNGRFVHASSSHGVMVSNLSDSYWQARYLGARRVLATTK